MTTEHRTPTIIAPRELPAVTINGWMGPGSFTVAKEYQAIGGFAAASARDTGF
jgi:hypothetical protein